MVIPGPALEISPALLAELDKHVYRALPEECCGVLVGIPGRLGTQPIYRITAVWPAENAEPGDRTRGYRIAPEELLQAHERALQDGADVIGYYHSHPGGGAEPSERDLAEAAPGISYLIVAVEGEVIAEHRCWRLRPDRSKFHEERLLSRRE